MAVAEREIFWDLSENLCCVGLDYDKELKSTAESSDRETTCELPEGNIKVVGAKRFCCVASVPAQFHWCTSQWIPGRLWTKHHECDVYTRKEVYANVVLSGGTTILQGSGEHMTRIDGVGATHDEFSFGCSPPERKFGIDLSLSLQKMWASRFDSERYL